MVNLKADLINELILRKNYLERDLVRCGELPDSMEYKHVVYNMLDLLKQIGEVDMQMSYIDRYFKEIPVQAAQAPVPEPVTNGDQSNG